MKYSIILPVRNGGEHLKQCVRSILAQTYPDFELVVLENGSTDGSPQWIESLKDPRIRLLPSERDLSIEENWARIVHIPKNEFITLIGHDDLLDPDYLDVMDKLISLHPGATLYQAHFRMVDAEGGLIRSCKPMKEKELADEFLASVLKTEFDLFGTGFMIRSVDYDQAGGIPDYPNLLFADFELWMQITMKGYKATDSAECFSYRIHQSTTKTSTDLKMLQAFNRFVEYLKNLSSARPEMAKVIIQYFPVFLQAYCKGLSHRLIRSPLKERKGLTVRKFIKNCEEYANRLGLKSFNPYSSPSVLLAAAIDSNHLSRYAFRMWKKIYSKPVLK